MNNFAIYVKLVDNDRLLIKKILLDRAEKRKRGDSMKWHPLVSVILPTWNRAKYLPQAMDSVLSQDYKNLELFVVDDGSTDETGQIVNSYKDDRICYIRTSVNRGAAAARNLGISCATGEFIMFQNSNSVWRPGKLRKELEKFSDVSMDTVVVYHSMARVTSEGKCKEIPDSSVMFGERSGRLFDKLLKQDFIKLPAVCIRRTALVGADGIGTFDNMIPDLEDYDLILRIARRYRIDYINEILADTYYIEDGANCDMFRRVKSNCLIIKKYKEDMRRIGVYAEKLRYLRELGKITHTERIIQEMIERYGEGE